jgi:hypothetical protein
MIGKVYGIPPQPPVAEHTYYVPAGNLRLGIEYRSLDPESLVETYKHDAAQLAEMLDRSPEGGFTDEGLSLHVCSADDGHEYVRFDVFDSEPHYHYNHPADPEVINNVIDFDTAAHGDMLPWAIACLRGRLPAMLTEAGGGALVDGLDQAAIDAAVDQIAAMASQVRAAAKA